MTASSNQPLVSNQLPLTIDLPKEEKELREFFTDYLRRNSNIMNTKEGAYYLPQELANYKQLYTRGNNQKLRNGYRRVFDLIALNGGNIGAGATVSFAHNIQGLAGTLIIYASCTSIVPNYFSVMGYPDVYLDATNVNFTNPTVQILNQVDVIAEYVKQAAT